METGCPQSQRLKEAGSLLRSSPQREHGPATLYSHPPPHPGYGFRTPGPQDCERTHFCRLFAVMDECERGPGVPGLGDSEARSVSCTCSEPRAGLHRGPAEGHWVWGSHRNVGGEGSPPPADTPLQQQSLGGGREKTRVCVLPPLLQTLSHTSVFRPTLQTPEPMLSAGPVPPRYRHLDSWVFPGAEPPRPSQAPLEKPRLCTDDDGWDGQ